MQDERNSEPGEDAEGFRRLNEDDDEVEAHRTGLSTSTRLLGPVGLA